jgi:uncharacterized membrane protein
LTSSVILVLAVFGASCVEAVEALTLVVAAGSTRGWRSAFEGAASALVLLIVLVAVIGIPLVRYVPIDVLRVVIGGLLLVLGLGWLRKSILRASGHKALHDEDVIFAKTVAELAGEQSASRTRRDAIGFTIAFKGVLLEGTEVLLIVLSLGASSHRLGLAAAAAAAAALVVTVVGIVVARQLREVPENTMKLGVGVMLTSFGVFWIGEGSGFRWPGSDLAILVLIGVFLAVTALSIRFMRSILPPAVPTPSPLESRPAP